MVRVKDLSDQTGVRAVLHCTFCDVENSADADAYWDASPDHVFKCCDREMELRTKSNHLHE